MMKKIIIATFLMIGMSMSPVSAQGIPGLPGIPGIGNPFAFHLTTGINLSNLDASKTDANFSEQDYTYGLGGHIGLEAGFTFFPQWSLSYGGSVAYKSTTRKSTALLNNIGQSSLTKDITSTWIEIPVRVHYAPLPMMDIFAGGFFGYRLSLDGLDKDDLKKSNIGVTVGSRLNLLFAEISLAYNLGLSDLTNTTSDTELKTQDILLTAKFNF